VAVEVPPAPLPEEVVVKPGDTLMNLLLRAGIASAEAHDAMASLADVYDPRQLRAGQTVALELDRDDAADGARLASLSLDLDVTKGIRIARNDDGGFAATTVLRELKSRQLGVDGVIETSLYADGVKAGIPGEMLAAMVKLFSWDVDFERDTQPGSSFAAVFEERATEDGRDAGAGDLLFASLGLGDRTISAYRFERPDGSTGWYDHDGHSMRKSLLRTPIDGARLSSRFGPRRHPVLGYSRMHKGVDFAAPKGTPIFAAGDGQIDYIGSNKGYGRYIRIRHNSEYSTAYGHMSRFLKGLARGAKVRQGDVIGYVGATGLATGPHLHYEILKHGTQINPLSAKQTFADSLTGGDLVRFRRTVAEIDRLRGRFDGGRLVAQSSDPTAATR
jgi:murein DD-endopeptidase MepM/ murein hydrolase activator NlpD